jgi:hypothetical protein
VVAVRVAVGTGAVAVGSGVGVVSTQPGSLKEPTRVRQFLSPVLE